MRRTRMKASYSAACHLSCPRAAKPLLAKVRGLPCASAYLAKTSTDRLRSKTAAANTGVINCRDVTMDRLPLCQERAE